MEDLQDNDSQRLTSVRVPFSGNPRRYRMFAVVSSIAIHAYLYGGLCVLSYLIHGQTWIFAPKYIVTALVSCLVYGRLTYSWIMQLDAQYGRGSAWEQTSRRVKLPEFVSKQRRHAK